MLFLNLIKSESEPTHPLIPFLQHDFDALYNLSFQTET